MRIILFTIYFVFGITLTVESRQIEGKIIDCNTHEGIYLVNVGIKGTAQGAISDESGKFVINDVGAGNYTLIVSMIGYELRHVHISVPVVSDDSELTISLCEKSIDLEQVVITGTRSERLLKNVPVQTQLISAKAIERMQMSNFRDLLEYEMPGVEFTNNGGFSNINMMGFGGKYVLFLVDGERMAGETFDNIDYNRVDLDNIRQIEIVKGASSSLYGSNAVGGVINIISKKPESPFESGLSLRTGSNNEQNYRYRVGTRQKWGYASLSASIKSMNPYLLDDTEPVIQWFDNGKKLENPLSSTYIAGYRDYSITPSVGTTVSEKFEVEAKGGFYFKERNPGGLDGRKVTDDYYSYSGGLKGNYKFSERTNLLVSVNFDRYDKFKNYKLLNEKEKNYENSQYRLSTIYNMEWEAGHSLVTGAEMFSDKLVTYMFISDGTNTARSAGTFALYAQQELKMSERITFVGGLRYDYHSRFKGHLTPRLSAMYRPASNTTIRGGYSGGFRSPTLKELHTDWFHPDGGGFQIIGNKNMEPEKSNNFNLSAEVSLGRTVLTAMGQYSMIDNMVNTVWVNNDTVNYANIGDAGVLSTEVSATTRILKNLTFRGGYSFVKDNLGRKSIVRPHSATARLEYSTSFKKKYNSTVSLSGKYYSEMDIYGTGEVTGSDSETGIEKDVSEEYRVHYEEYAVFRFTLSQSMPFNIVLNAGVNNLFDYKPKFSSFYSSISPGRTFFVGMKWDF